MCQRWLIYVDTIDVFKFRYIGLTIDFLQLRERNESAHSLQILLERANLKRAPKVVHILLTSFKRPFLVLNIPRHSSYRALKIGSNPDSFNLNGK